MKIVLVASLLAFATALSAQVNLGVKGGVNMSNFYGDSFDDKDVKIGFNVGLLLDYDFRYDMGIQTGLFFTTKGSKPTYDFPIIGEVEGATFNANYLQLPVHYAYKLDVSPGTRIVFHGGPYAAYGIGGKITFDGNDLADTFGDDGLLKPFDFGLGVGVGAEFGQFIVDLGWDMGLIDISDIDALEYKNQNAYLSIGYKF